MKVAKWGNSLAVRLPKAVVDKLGLKVNDEVRIVASADRTLEIARGSARERTKEEIRALRRTLPADYKFDREEANER